MTDYVKLGDLELTLREYRALKIIIDFTATDPYHQPPSHREVVDALNKLGDHVISTEQTMRVAYSLRKKGLLVDINPAANHQADQARRSRNLVPTDKALRALKRDPKPA